MTLKVLFGHAALLAKDKWQGRAFHPDPSARMGLRPCAPILNDGNADLPRWLDWFNRSRPHSALNGLPLLSAVNSIMRSHS
ncbi:hypothetical protein LZ186_02540 [Rhodovulum sulfidophilum]|nr:hypothetical protein [Rhodovulum sulfidophilum]